jgi:hypothetical protein
MLEAMGLEAWAEPAAANWRPLARPSASASSDQVD